MKIRNAVLVIFLCLGSITALRSQCDIENYDISYCGAEELIDLTAFEPNPNGSYQYFVQGALVDDPANYFANGTTVLDVEFSGDGITCPAVITNFSININQEDFPELEIESFGELSCILVVVELVVTPNNNPDLVYSWFANGIFITQGPVLLVEEPGVFVVEAMDLTTGCTSVDSITVVENIDFPMATVDTTNNCDGTFNINLSIQNIASNYEAFWAGPGILEEINDTSILVDLPGDYNVTITDLETGCSNLITISIVDMPCMDTGITDFSENLINRIYPMPSDDGLVTLEWGEGISGNATIKVYNAYGRSILERPLKSDYSSKMIIDLSEEAAGIFFITIQDGNSSWVNQLLILN